MGAAALGITYSVGAAVDWLERLGVVTNRAVAQQLRVPCLRDWRAAARVASLEPHSSLEEEGEAVLAHQAHPCATCGLGMNIYVAPDGACYPCYALRSEA